jgi:ABC-type nickel/cobalt efflux system permease component RcnA
MVLVAPAANAHPLGNFSVNRSATLEISRDAVVVRYAIDVAEIPTLQEKTSLDRDRDGILSAREVWRFSQESADDVLGAIDLEADGAPIALEREESFAELLPGSGGLDVLRIEATFAGPLPSPDTTILFSDASAGGRVGWHEVVARAVGGQGLVRSDVPERSPSDELHKYPNDLLSSPINVSEATIEVSPGATGRGAAVDHPISGEGFFGDMSARFTSLVERDLSPGPMLFAIALALAAGGLHALGPGHGKTVMAAYLVGAEGRVRHAVIVGVAVSLMHTASVVLLGLITLWASNVFPPEEVYPWLSLLSGLVVLGLGGWLLKARLRRMDPVGDPHDRQHAHDHSHAHVHAHAHGIEHHHEVASGPSPLTWRGMTAVALSGGLLPSPTALVVLLGAVALHRVALGVTLVAAFSIGLAAALTIVGILVLKARTYASRKLSARTGALLPVLSAAALLAVGVFLTAQATTTF